MFDREHYAISRWHVLQLFLLNEKAGGYGLTVRQAQDYFNYRAVDKVIKKLHQGNYLSRIPKPKGKPWPGWVYQLGGRSRRFLKRHDLWELGFLSSGNPYLEKSKEIVRVKRKLWKDQLFDVPQSP